VLLAAFLPTAAGLMLTFPALNGLAFYFSPPPSIAPMARTMLWMPVVNGGLCALYLGLYLLSAKRGSPEVVAVVLAGLVTCLWLVAVAPRFVRAGIPPRHQITYCVASTVIGVLMVAGAVFMAGAGTGTQAGATVADVSLGAVAEAIAGSTAKIALFALCLSVFLAAGTWQGLPDWARGLLGSLPLVPFGGLLGVAADSQMALEQRSEIFRAMAVSIWLAPAIAIWFIYGVARVLAARRSTGIALTDDLVRLSVIVTGWVICLCAILTIATIIQR
jgi:hypothetical protein